MRLASTIIAVFLALSMAVFPITMVRASAMGGHSHAATAQATHDHHDHVAVGGTDGPSLASVDEHCDSADNAAHNDASSCCGMGACHVFQMSAAPSVSTPAGSAQVLQAPGDEQVTGAFSVRIDRPPRTV